MLSICIVFFPGFLKPRQKIHFVVFESSMAVWLGWGASAHKLSGRSSLAKTVGVILSAAAAWKMSGMPHLVFVAEQLVLHVLYYAEIWLALILVLWGLWHLFLRGVWRGYLMCKACVDNKADEVERLLQAGVEPDSYIDYVQGGTALHFAFSKGHASVVQVLVKASRPELLLRRLKNGCTCLHLAAESGNASAVTCVETLLAATAPASRSELLLQCMENGMSCLHPAVLRGRIDIVKCFLLAGAQPLVNVRSKEGDSPLHLAARTGRVDILRLLLDSGAEKDVQTDHGRTGVAYHYPHCISPAPRPYCYSSLKASGNEQS